jgi:hypothetical protein
VTGRTCTYSLCKPQPCIDDLASVIQPLEAHGRTFSVVRDPLSKNWEVRIPPEDVPGTPEWKAAHPDPVIDKPSIPEQPTSVDDLYSFRLTGWGAAHNGHSTVRDLEGLYIPYVTKTKRGHNTMYSIFIRPEDIAKIERCDRAIIKAHLTRRDREARQ